MDTSHDPGNAGRLPMALTAYGLPHVMGYLRTRGGEAHPAPLTPTGFMDAAVDLGLAGVDMAVTAPGMPSSKALREELEARNLRLVAETGVLVDMDPAEYRGQLEAAGEAGAKVVRALISSVLCGRRAQVPEGWEERLRRVAARLREFLPVADDLGLCIALENHQDATTDDLLTLAEMVDHHPAVGVTLDAGNPLSVGEDPVTAARRLGPLIRHLHLKDYKIHFAPDGYRLVRCVAGTGVVDFPAILEIVRGNGHDLLPGIEIAAQATRTIPVLENEWWATFPPRPATEFLPALRVLWTHGRPMSEPYSSAWERGESSAAVTAEEWEVVRGSVAYFRTLAAKRQGNRAEVTEGSRGGV
jgi:3-oxoisoapionate decarboxylase